MEELFADKIFLSPHRHLQVFWGKSGHFWQNCWDHFLDNYAGEKALTLNLSADKPLNFWGSQNKKLKKILLIQNINDSCPPKFGTSFYVYDKAFIDIDFLFHWKEFLLFWIIFCYRDDCALFGRVSAKCSSLNHFYLNQKFSSTFLSHIWSLFLVKFSTILRKW